MKSSYRALLLVPILLPVAAQAADMPIKAAPRYAPAIYDWSGFYLGANAGWNWTRGSGTISFGPATGPVSGSGNGFLGGLQAGYNWQTGPVVLGLETDLQLSATKGNLDGGAGGTTFTSTAKVPWFGTIRARAGYAVNTWLFYVTGGAVYGQSKLDGTVSTVGAFSSTRSFWTWAAGAGVETALWDRWSAKLEYLYMGTPNHVALPPGADNISGTIDTHIVRVGLNYRF